MILIGHSDVIINYIVSVSLYDEIQQQLAVVVHQQHQQYKPLNILKVLLNPSRRLTLRMENGSESHKVFMGSVTNYL